MNKKGQVLVTFVLLIPLIVMFLGFIIDIGNYAFINKKIENVLNNTITYALENKEIITEARIEEIINDNIDDYKSLNININEDNVMIKIVKENKSVFNILDVGINRIELNFSGDFITKEITRK